MNNIEEKMFFSSMCNALIDEDRELRVLFQNNIPLYSQQHNGICCLYETTMVYQVLKRLMKDRFKYSASWEHPYPGNPGLKADMALLNMDKSIDSFIEFKIWTSYKGDEVRGDVDKYLRTSFSGGKYLAIVEYGGPDIADNCKYLMHMNPEIEFINMKSFSTRFYDSWNTKQIIDNPVNIYFFKMKENN